ncbi:MAG: bifunctional DNA-formamidopyrimidine glycosylase/DNA-(apurinic or apyrimidinic site) lyase [Gemmatimonadota bacterium]
MPELPEVETMVSDLRPTLVGRTVVDVTLTHDDLLRWTTKRRLVAGLRGSRVVGMSRRAKNAVIETDRRRLVIQPGMTGSMAVKKKLAPTDLRYGVLRATLDNGRTFVYHDVRRLGTILWLDDRLWNRFSAALGPEPLEPEFTAAALGAILGRSRAAVKKVLMDQRHLAGVGNIYANEALFAAGIDPSKEARRVTPDQVQKLHAAIVRILRAAVEADGTTFRDYRTGTGEPGSFQLALAVYEREGEPCLNCGTLLAGTHEIDARISVFCYRCQA